MNNIYVFTLDDNNTQPVIFSPRTTFFYVPKNTEHDEKSYRYAEISEQKMLTSENVENTFKDYHIYILFQPGLIIKVFPIKLGGSRKNHRKSAKRVRISKKSSQTRVRKYRK